MAIDAIVTSQPARIGARANDWIGAGAVGVAGLVCAGPALAVLAAAAHAAFTGHAALGDRLLWESLWGTISLVLSAGVLATLLGAVLAWVVHTFAFPGRSVFSWALALPLAAPAYVLAYAYGGLTGPLGPAPVGLSGALGAGFVYVIAFYPYAFLAVRAALAAQSVCALEAAAILGASPWRRLTQVTAPLAWPAIAAGGALTAMEIAADYGAAQYFGALTLSTGVFRAWFGHGDVRLAVQIGAVLLAAATALLLLEHHWRGRRVFAGGSTRWRARDRIVLTPAAALIATAACALVFAAALVAPVGWLLRLAAFGPPEQASTLIGPFVNSVVLASAGTVITLTLAWILAHAGRTRFGMAAGATASSGYAAPGAVMALGGLMSMGAAREFGLIGGMGASAALAMLLWIYAARFAAAGIGPMAAGLHAVTPSHTAAARTLGAGRWRRMIALDIPIAAPAVFGAALIVFVEILKELPATLILRPFDFDTLAVIAHNYAADDRLNAAALPALMILLAGLAPTLALSTQLERARAGANGGAP